MVIFHQPTDSLFACRHDVFVNEAHYGLLGHVDFMLLGGALGRAAREPFGPLLREPGPGEPLSAGLLLGLF